jgi:hypothetical protein
VIGCVLVVKLLIVIRKKNNERLKQVKLSYTELYLNVEQVLLKLEKQHPALKFNRIYLFFGNKKYTTPEFVI